MILAAFALFGLAFILSLVAVVWQTIEAFKTSTTWGIFSILGILCLGLIPNLIWVIMNWDRGWPMLVTWAGSLPPFLIGMWIFLMEGAASAG